VIDFCPEAVRLLDAKPSLIPHIIGAIRALSLEMDVLNNEYSNRLEDD